MKFSPIHLSIVLAFVAGFIVACNHSSNADSGDVSALRAELHTQIVDGHKHANATLGYTPQSFGGGTAPHHLPGMADVGGSGG